MAKTSDLRYILRLIHCLQRERGASCALAGIRYPSEQPNESRTFSLSSSLDNVNVARRATNAAIKGFYRSQVVDASSRNMASKLRSIRQLVDEGACEDKEKYNFVHTVVQDFSSLSWVLNEKEAQTHC